MWVAYLNLECTFGTEKTSEAVIQRATRHNDAKQVGKRRSGFRQLLASLLGARTLLGTKGIATRSKDASRLEAIALSFPKKAYEPHE